MILDNFTQDRDVTATVASISYVLGTFHMLYAYGDFKGDADGLDVKEHLIEQNIGAEYHFNNEFTSSIIYVIDDYKEGDSAATGIEEQTSLRFMMTYNF